MLIQVRLTYWELGLLTSSLFGANSVEMLKFDDKLLLFLVFMRFDESLINLQQYDNTAPVVLHLS